MSIVVSFAKCPVCGMQWMRREDFLNDAHIKLVGYDANLDIIRLGKFQFSHFCGATLPIQVDAFADLYNGPIYTERKTGSDECTGYCKKREELRACPAKCECAWVREVIQKIKKTKNGVN